MGKSRRPKRRYEHTPVHVNPSTFVFFVVSTLVGVGACAAFGLVVEKLQLEPSNWIAVPILLVFLLTPALLMVYVQVAHRLWTVSDSTITTVQTGRGGSYHQRALPNQHFSKVQPFGPFVVVHHYSGKRYVWPRWLRHAKRTYTFELYYDRVRLKLLS